MKKTTLISFALIMLSSIGNAQSDDLTKQKKIKGYKVRIMFIDDREPIRGYLYAATDSSVVVIPTNKKYQFTDGSFRLEIPIKEIKKIKKSVKAAALIGAIPGFIGGAILGGVAGIYSGSNATVIFAGAIGGVLFGALTSGITTAFASKVYRINGDLVKYKTMYMSTLQEKSMVNREILLTEFDLYGSQYLNL